MSKTVKVLVSVLAAIGLLAGCTAAPAATPTQAPADTEKAALEEQVEVLTGKIEQLQDKIDELQKENEALQSDSGASVAVDDLAYLLNTISASGQALTSFPALVSAMAASGEGYMLTISRLEDETGGNNAGAAPEDVYADVFTYAYYDGYLMPELDEGFGDYIKDGDGVQFIVYMLGDQVIFLNEILVP
ncbi:MAG: hypothetical protein ACOX8N_09560 [Christensenellales bacterium]|jgi:outer membrane murein-binding lipoprotein Lpp